MDEVSTHHERFRVKGSNRIVIIQRMIGEDRWLCWNEIEECEENCNKDDLVLIGYTERMVRLKNEWWDSQDIPF